MVKAHQSAKARAIRKIDRIKAQHIYNVATAFLIGLAVGVMLTTWLH
jgi:capsular polysaccharide biosynthesis protein